MALIDFTFDFMLFVYHPYIGKRCNSRIFDELFKLPFCCFAEVYEEDCFPV